MQRSELMNDGWEGKVSFYWSFINISQRREWAGAKESNKIDIKTMQTNLLV